MQVARFISFWTGFCSLSLEIAWVRLYGFANNSTPQAFGFVLAVYLLGIALGAQLGKRICRMPDRKKIEKTAFYALAVSAVMAVITPWAYLYSRVIAMDDLVAPLGMLLTAGSLALLFPITHHLGTPDNHQNNQSSKGKHFSRVYMLNVAGAALGPLVTGYVLLEILTITQIFAFLGCLIGLSAAIAYWLFVAPPNRRLSFVLMGAMVVPVLFMILGVMRPHEFVHAFASIGASSMHAVHESRHGIITIAKQNAVIRKKEPFVDYAVYGGNVYDGKVNIDLERNTNGLHRPLATHVLQPKAKRALVLGLSIGSWLTVLEGFPGIDHIDVVEINPGYLSMAEEFPAQSRALKDPRVRLHIDDARRWLQYHPDERYDIILMNTTWHWRANSSMLLSREMMQIIQRHLSPQGVVTFNATGSVDAFATAESVFKHVRRYDNFIYAADWDAFSRVQTAGAWEVLRFIMIDGHPALGPESMQIKKFSDMPFIKLDVDLKKIARKAEVITDDNMLVEYKHGRWN